MLETEVYVKTDAGRDEIKSRALGLPTASRAILLMVDGQRSVSAMRALIAGSKAPADVLDTLIGQGLIESRSHPMAAPAAMPVPAPVPAVPASPRPPPIKYDGPIDLVLPTIYADPGAGVEAPFVTATAPPLGAVAVPMPAPTQPPLVAAVTAPLRAPVPPAAAPVIPNRYEHLYKMMNEIVRDFLAPHRRYFIQLKIERCGTPDELLELLHDLQTALAKARGDAFAAEVIARVRAAAQ